MSLHGGRHREEKNETEMLITDVTMMMISNLVVIHVIYLSFLTIVMV
jgi:hypothetical protein